MPAFWRSTLPLRWAVGFGALSGLVAAGVGSRVVMKLIALADPSTDGTVTDVEPTVGEFTVAGTLSLLVLVSRVISDLTVEQRGASMPHADFCEVPD